MTAITADYAAARPRFYFWTAIAMMATAFLGFAPTFWVPIAQGLHESIAIIAIHATIFFGWTLFFVYQTWLVASGQSARHRNTGLIGVSLATAMVIFGTMAAINAAQRAAAMNDAVAGEAFMIVPMAGLFSFTILLVSALYNTARPEWHKRLMLCASAVILGAAIARPFIVFIVMGGHPPPFQGTVGLAGFHQPPPPVVGVLLPELAALLFIVAGMIYDRRNTGKVHPAYWWAGSFALAVQLLKIPFSDTALWHGIARGLMSLAG